MRQGTKKYYINLHGLGEPGSWVDDEERPYWLPCSLFEAIVQLARTYGDRVRLTFDDGNMSDLEIALPILLREEVGAQFFIVSDRIDRPGYLSADGIRRLVESGMRIGSHGREHVRWTSLASTRLDAEISEPLARLAEIVAAPVDEVAVPFGAYDRHVLRALRTHGVRRVYTSDRGLASATGWLVPRNTLRNDADIGTLRHAIEAGIPLGTQLRATAGRLKRQYL